jgi:hypothetical protein
LAREAHPQLDSLGGGVPVYSADHLLDLHKVKRGLGLSRKGQGGEGGENTQAASGRRNKTVSFHGMTSVELAAQRASLKRPNRKRFHKQGKEWTERFGGSRQIVLGGGNLFLLNAS